MHHAPSVSYPAGRCALWGFILLAVALVMAGVFWRVWPSLAVPVRWACGAGLLLWCVWAVHGAVRQPRGWIRYHAPAPASPVSGPAWAWLRSPGADPVPLHGLRVVVDLQDLLLIELAGGAAAPRWAWLSASGAPADWLALRRALRFTAPA
jgi:hypothetical protein